MDFIQITYISDDSDNAVMLLNPNQIKHIQIADQESDNDFTLITLADGELITSINEFSEISDLIYKAYHN